MSLVADMKSKLSALLGQAPLEADYPKVGYHLSAVIDKEQVQPLAGQLKEQGFFLEFVTAVDRLDHLEVVYMFGRFSEACRVKATVDAPKGMAVPSVAGIFPTANWHERETYDMLGQVFLGHPDLRRILLPEDADFHPLLKDFQTGAGSEEE